MAFTNCCENESVNIGVITLPKGYNTKLSYTVNRYLESKSVLKSRVNTFLQTQNYTEEAHDHVENQVLNMITDVEYEQLVNSSFGFTPIMWEIAKELVGDKAVDIILKVLPGFSETQKLKDAIKAAKNGDWIDFSFEVGKIIAQNTPIGKMLKIGEASSDMYKFIKNVEKVHSRISAWSTTKTTQIWNIVKKNIKLASNSNFWKYVDDLAYPKFGLSTTTRHLDVFDGVFPGVRIDMEVHHAVPKRVLNNKTIPFIPISSSLFRKFERN